MRISCGAVDPVFNSFVNTPSSGHERAFLDARLEKETQSGAYADPLDVGEPDGQLVVVRLYVNTGANEALGARSTAHGTRVQISLPTVSGRALRAVGRISADNATSPWQIPLTFVSNQGFIELEYVPGVSVLVSDATFVRDEKPLPDSLVAEGTLISNTGVMSLDWSDS